jgi:hypothetical protein
VAYSQTTLAQFIAQVGVLLDDTAGVYWTSQEITYALWEVLRVFGSYTSYWKASGSFNVSPASPTPYYDMSVLLPTLRPRTYTLGQMVQEIQYMLLENPSGIAGTGMSGQVSISNILDSITIARNMFVLDTHLPIAVHSAFASPNTGGLVSFPQASVFVHRASWQDTASGTWYNLYRSDEWEIDKSNYLWNTESGPPQVYSEAVLSPLQLQLAPVQSAPGSLEALTVDSVQMDTTNPNSLFGVPDEWVWAIKYAALSLLLGGDSQIADPIRAQYAGMRYQQAVEFAKDARSITRITVGTAPLNMDALYNVDTSYPTWRNQVGPPVEFGSLYDIFVLVPGIPDNIYPMYANVVQAPPLPVLPGDYLQIGDEDVETLERYVAHILTFKCGGKDFTQTIPYYDEFMKGVSGRKGVNAAKIRYFSPIFGQPQVEWAKRPDRIMERS